MRSQTSYFLIGLFVIGGVLLGTGLLVALVGREDTSRTIMAETLLDESVSGLEIGAPVRFRGVKVGQVRQIELAQVLYDEPSNLIVVRFSINPRSIATTREEFLEAVEEKVRQGLRVRLASSGLSGVAYLEADNVKDPENHPTLPHPWTPADDGLVYIPSMKSTITTLVDSATEFLTNLSDSDVAGFIVDGRKTLQEFRDALAALKERRLYDDFDSLLLRSTEAIEEFRELAEQMRGVIGDPKIQSILANLEGGTAKLDRLLGNPEVEATVADIHKAGKEAEASMIALQGAIDHASRFFAEANRLVQGKDRDLEAILSDLRQITVHMKNFTRTLESYPSYAIWGTAPERERSDR